MRDLEFDIKAKDRTGSGFDSAEARAKRFNSQLGDTASGFDLAALAARAFAGAFTLTALENIGQIARATITAAADMVDLADKVGVTTEELQRLTYGFEVAGVAVGDVDQVLSQWSKRIGAAYTQGGKLAEILKANGVSLTDSEGKLRSSVDLMRSYADLIANAGSDQERMTLATEAFGKAGSSMVLALRDGADGLDRLMGLADDAGGVLEDELLRRAADIDDAFNKMWRNFEMESKRAILATVTFMADFFQKLRENQKAANIAAAGREIGTMGAELFGKPIRTGRLPSPIDQRISGAFAVTDIERDDAMARALRDRFAPRTVIPGGSAGGVGGGRSSSSSALREQESAYDRVIRKLNDEYALIGKSDTAQRIMTEQRRANVLATSEQGRAIAALVTKIEDEERAYKAAKEASDFFDDNLKQSFAEMLPQIETGNRALDGFINRLIQAAAEAAFFGDGPLGGLFGGGGLMGILGFRAAGGPVDPWGSYVVGENGPEILKMGPSGGTVIPNDQAFAGGGSGPLVLVGEIRTFFDDDGKLDARMENAAVRVAGPMVANGVGRLNAALPERFAEIMERRG